MKTSCHRIGSECPHRRRTTLCNCQLIRPRTSQNLTNQRARYRHMHPFKVPFLTDDPGPHSPSDTLLTLGSTRVALPPLNGISVGSAVLKGSRTRLACRPVRRKCSNLDTIRQRFFRVSSLKDLFDNIDNRAIIDFIKESHFYALA